MIAWYCKLKYQQKYIMFNYSKVLTKSKNFSVPENYQELLKSTQRKYQYYTGKHL